MTSGTNQKQIAAAKKQQARDRDTDREVIQALMRTVAGRRWVWLRLSEAQIFVESETLDHAAMAYEKGRRNAGLRLLQTVNRFAPEMYIRMTSENTGVELEEPTTETEEPTDG